MIRTIMIVGGALGLTACGPETSRDEPAVPETNLVNAVTGGNDVVAVLEMNDAQRRLVFARALVDADIACDGVVKAVRVPDSRGLPMWRAECKNGTAHAISITPDGTASILSR